MMRSSGLHLWMVGLAAALVMQGCGGDSGPGTSNQNAGQTGAGGGASSKGGPSSCTPTRCPKDVEYTVYSQQYCDDAEKGPCGAELKAKVQCALANETCTADGIQDRSKVDEVCKAELDAFDKCNATLAGGS